MTQERTPSENAQAAELIEAAIPSRKKANLRRIIMLALLGTTIGLVALKFASSMRHDLTLEVVLLENLNLDLSELMLQVVREGEEADAQNSWIVVFRIDPEHPLSSRLQHGLRLPNGRYQLSFTGRRKDDRPFSAARVLEVSGDTQVTLEIP